MIKPVLHLCIYTVFMLSGFFLQSCIEERTIEPDGTTNKAIDITLVFKLPSERKSPDTFDLSESDENHLSTIDILVFKIDSLDNSKEYFAYKVEGRDITDTQVANQKKVTVTLLTGANNNYRLVALANARNEIKELGEINPTTSKENILNRLIFNNNGVWITDTENPNYKSIPMWGESGSIKINQHTQLVDNINLLRMFARIDVQVAESMQDSFKLKSVRLYNHNTKGFIVPILDSEHWDGQKVLKPSIPVPSGKQKEPLLYNQLTVQDRSITGTIYTFESQSVDESSLMDATCLVIGGEYKNEGFETFYRVDFTYTDIYDQIHYANILRNHLYNINLVKVSGSGYPNPDDAFENESINITSDIEIWDSGNTSEVTLGGIYKLRVNQSEFTLPMNQRTAIDQDNKLTVFTNFSEGWTVEKIVDKDGNFIPASWLTLNLNVGSPNTETTISILADENNTEIDRTAYIHIKADRMVYVVKVIQTTVPEIDLTVKNARGEEITELLFNSHVENSVPAQDLHINWLPTTKDCSISTITIVGTNNFDFGVGDVISSGTITNASGQKIYRIQPPPMTQAEIDSNPFLEKALRVDFTVNSGVTYVSKILFLIQKNYAAVPRITSEYLMDGNEHFFTINANAPWEIEVVDDPSRIIQELITTRGGLYEDKRDEKVYFRLIDDMANPSIFKGNVTFKIKSTNSGRPFPDRLVTIDCYSLYSRKTLLTIGSSPDGFGYNFSGTAASNKLITSASNFGPLSQSVFKAEGFTIINGGINPTQLQMQEWLVNNPVDMVVIGYDNANLSTTIANYYLQYLNNGGVVLAFQDRIDDLVSGNLLKTILGNGITITYGTGAGSVYPFTTLNHEVLNGPFGDIRGLQWGEDASTTVRISGINAGLVDILSDDKDISQPSAVGTGAVTAFKHKTLNMVWVGDGGFNSNNGGVDVTICPFKLNASNYPIAKPGYGRGTVKLPVYNSVFTANAISWAIKQAHLKNKRKSSIK